MDQRFLHDVITDLSSVPFSALLTSTALILYFSMLCDHHVLFFERKSKVFVSFSFVNISSLDGPKIFA